MPNSWSIQLAPVDVDPLAVEPHPARGRHPGHRIVLRGVAGRRPLPAEAVLPVEDRPLPRLEAEVDPERPVDHLEPVQAAVEGRPPVAVPDVEGPRSCARPSEPAPVEPLPEQMPAALEIGHRQMGHVEIADRPPRRVLGGRVDADAEEGDLIAEPAASVRGEVAGVVPPLDAVLRVAAVIAGKPPDMAGPRLSPAIPGHRPDRLLAGGRPRMHRNDGADRPRRLTGPGPGCDRERKRQVHPLDGDRRDAGSAGHDESAVEEHPTEKRRPHRKQRHSNAAGPPPTAAGPPRCHLSEGAAGAGHRSAPAATREATRAGYRPASAVVTAMRTVDCARNPTGRWNWMVQPKLCTLMT